MSIKQKFESIDQSQLSENQKEILGKIKTATKDFTITDQKALEKVDGALDNIITKLKATNPQAIKGEAKKREPKAKKEVVKKEPKSETKKPKEAKKEAGGKRTIFSIAKEIRKADESWDEAKKRAKKVMETEKEDTTKKMKSETDKLLSFIKRRKELEGLSGTSVKKDSKIEALPKGRRISKKGWKNQHGESEGGKVYYENRDNRTDRLAPNFADKIYLEGGGYAGGGYVVIAKSEKGGGFVMSKPTTKAKAEKLKSLLPKIDGETNEVMTIGKAIKLSGLVGKEYLKYADGGAIIGTPETPLARDLGISYTGLVGETGAMSSGEMFMAGGSIKEVSKISDFMKYLSSISNDNAKTTNRDVNKISEFIKFLSSISNENKELKSLTLKIQDDLRGLIKSLNSKEKISKEEIFSIQDDLRDVIKSTESGSFSNGGSLTLTPETPLARDLGISYTGLVGETGAMSSGEMFAKGGMVVTSVKDIPNFKERLEQRRITYRGLGMGKVADDFYKLAGTSGTRIKVDGKEYFITDEEFNTFSRDADGKMQIRFDAPARKGYDDGGFIDKYEVDRFKQVMNGKAIAKYIVRVEDSFKNKETYVFGIKIKDQFKGCELVPYESLFSDWGSSGTAFSVDNLQVKKLVPDSFTKIELDEEQTEMLVNKLVKNNVEGVKKFLNSSFFYLNYNQSFEDILKTHFQRSVVKVVSIEFEIMQKYEQGGSLVDGYLTDPNFGDFQAGVYADGGSTGLPAGTEQHFVNYYLGEGTAQGIYANGGSTGLPAGTEQSYVNYYLGEGSAQGVYAQGGSLGNHGLKEGDQVLKTMSGGIQKVKTKSGDIVYVNLANGYRGAEPPLPFDDGGMFQEKMKWQDVEVGDSARVKEIGRMGLVVKTYGRKFHLRFPNGTEKTFDANELEFIEDNDDFKDGGKTRERRFVNHGQDYEVRYSKDKPKRRGYGYADGGTIDAFQMRTVRGIDNMPTEILTDEQKVQFAKGGSIKNEDIKVGEEFWLSNGDVIEIVRLFKENIDEDWVEYKRNGEKKENSVKELRLFINRLSGKKQKSWRERRNEYLEKLGQKEGDVWDKIGANSGADIRNSDKLLKAYAEGVEEMLQKEGVGKGSFDQEDYDFYTDVNWHLFNEFLVWNSYYEPEMTKTEKAWREKMYEEDMREKGKSNYVANPKIISLSGGSKSKSNNYVAKAKISTITIVKDGKEIVLSSKDVLNGVNLYDGGGKLKNDHTYFAKRYVKEVITEDGDKLKPSNGYWVKKSALKDSKKKVSLAKKPKFKVDDLVYNKRTKSVGIVRIEDERGETKTDADGNVNTSELQKYNPLKFKNQKDAKVSPSTQKEIDSRGLFKPFSFEVGGKTTFKQKATAIAKNFEGKNVEPKYQKEYGKTYDKAEAKEVGNKIAGSQKAKYDSKMSGGGKTKRGGAMQLAKQIRKDGESWQSALKRANEQVRNK